MDNDARHALEFLFSTEPDELKKLAEPRKALTYYKDNLKPIYAMWDSGLTTEMKDKKLASRLAQLQVFLGKDGNLKQLTKAFIIVLHKGRFGHPDARDLEEAFGMLSQDSLRIMQSDQNVYSHRINEILGSLEESVRKDRYWRVKHEVKQMFTELITLCGGWLYDLSDSAREFSIMEKELEHTMLLQTLKPGRVDVDPPSKIEFEGGRVGPGANESRLCYDEHRRPWISKSGRIHVQLSEFIAGKILTESGFPTPAPELAYHKKSGRILLLSKGVAGASNVSSDEFMAYVPKTIGDRLIRSSLLFMIWMHNRDARLYRNFITDAKGRYHMIDFGGSLLAKPRGSRRRNLLEDIDVKSFIDYLDYFRGGKFRNPFFKDITYDDLLRSARILESFPAVKIQEIVEYAYQYMELFRQHHKIFLLFHPFFSEHQLVQRLEARRRQIIDVVRQNKDEISRALGS